MITEIEDYFTKGCGRCMRFGTQDCSTRHWANGLQALRSVCLEAALEETVKWGHPAYMHAGRNVAMIGAFRRNFRLSFFNAGLLSDREGLLERSGPNTRHPDTMTFTDNGQPDARRAAIGAYLREAMNHAEKGTRADPDAGSVDLPEELAEALADDPELAGAFEALTRGRRKSYAIAVGGAKKPETRRARVEKFRNRIFAGKGATER